MFAKRVCVSQPSQGISDVWRGRQVEGVLYGADATTEGRPVNRIGTIVPAYTPMGRAWASNGSTDMARANLVNPFVLGTTPALTFVCVFRVVSGSASQVIASLGSDSGGSGNTLCLFRLGAASTGTINMVLQDSPPANVVVDITTSNFSASSGAWHTVVVSCDLSASGGAVAVYANGSSVGTTTRGASVNSATFQHVCAGGFRRTTDQVSAGQFQVALVAPIYAKLTNEEARELSINPWQLFHSFINDEFIGVPAAATFNAAWAMGNTVIYPGALNA